MRDLTPLILQAFTPDPASGRVTLEDPMVAVDMVLKDNAIDLETGELGTRFHWATMERTVDSINVLGVSTGFGPFTYQPKLRGVPQVSFSSSHATSGGSFTAVNLDNEVGLYVGQLEAVFNRADVRLHLCFKKSDGNYEADTLFVGRVVSVKGDQSACEFQVVADTDDKSAIVAGRQLTQNCVWLAVGGYKGPGCRYSGPEPECNGIKEDTVLGCRAKGWEAFFGGANFEVVLTSTANGFEYNDPDGYPGPGGGTYFGPGDGEPGGGRGRVPHMPREPLDRT
jgi:hypothetical protein